MVDRTNRPNPIQLPFEGAADTFGCEIDRDVQIPMNGLLSNRSSGRKKFDSNAAGGVRNIAGSWDVFDTDTDASKLSYEPAEREVEAPLDVRAQGSFQVSALDVNIDIHVFLGPLVFSPLLYRGRALFGQLETVLDTIRDSRSMIQGWNG